MVEGQKITRGIQTCEILAVAYCDRHRGIVQLSGKFHCCQVARGSMHTRIPIAGKPCRVQELRPGCSNPLSNTHVPGEAAIYLTRSICLEVHLLYPFLWDTHTTNCSFYVYQSNNLKHFARIPWRYEALMSCTCQYDKHFIQVIDKDVVYQNEGCISRMFRYLSNLQFLIPDTG